MEKLSLLLVVILPLVAWSYSPSPFDEELRAQGLLGSHFGIPGLNASFDYVILGGGTAGLTLVSKFDSATVKLRIVSYRIVFCQRKPAQLILHNSIRPVAWPQIPLSLLPSLKRETSTSSAMAIGPRSPGTPLLLPTAVPQQQRIPTLIGISIRSHRL